MSLYFKDNILFNKTKIMKNYSKTIVFITIIFLSFKGLSQEVKTTKSKQ